MTAPFNFLKSVQTFNESKLALLQNSYAFISTTNKKFKDFERDIPKNLGDSVTFDKPPRFTTTASLVASFQSANQRYQTLTIDQPISTSIEFTNEQFLLYNIEEYMQVFGKSAIAEIGSKIEENVARNAETHTFRFFGNGTTTISSYGQLAQALAFFDSFGSAKTKRKGYLPTIAIPEIINSGLNQFAPKRADRDAMTWEVSDFSNTEWYSSNLLPLHVSGTEGRQGSVLTVVSTVQDANGAVTAITFSGCNAANDVDSVKAYDKFLFSDGVSGQKNIRYLTFIGHAPSPCPVQFAAVSDAGSTGSSQVTVTINPPLQAAAGQDQNITSPIVAGMQVTVLPNHRCGLITAGDPLYLAMPRLPEQRPYDTASVMDKESGCGLRTTYGSIFGQNQRGLIVDAIWGSTLVDEYAMMLAFPE